MKKQNAITLIALIITIIVLLILAGISISMLVGDNGILAQASKAKVETEKAKFEEALQIKLTGMQLESLDDAGEIIEKLGGMTKGIYRIESYKNEKSVITGIFENEEELFEAQITVGQSNNLANVKVENIVSVSEVDDISKALYNVMYEDGSEVESISTGYDFDVIKYNEKEYNVWHVDTGSKIIIFIETADLFATTKWKNVFTDKSEIYALDTNDKLWVLADETTGLCLNNLYPEFNDFAVKDAIYSYDSNGERTVVGFIGTDGKIYILNLANNFEEKGPIVCFNDEFPAQLGSVKAEEVIPCYDRFYGLESVVREWEPGDHPIYFDCIIRDVDGKIWILYLYYDSDNIKARVVCLNTELEELNDIVFEKMVVSGIYESDYTFQSKDSRADYFTILGLDSNNKLWKIQDTDYDFENDTLLESYRFIAKDLVTTEGFPLIKDIDYTTSNYQCAIIDENNLLHTYTFVYEYEEVYQDISNSIPVKDYEDEWYLDENGNVYYFRDDTQTPLNDENFDSNKISKIYEYRFLIDENNMLYCESIALSPELENINFIKVSCRNSLFAGIDENNNIVIKELTK